MKPISKKGRFALIFLVLIEIAFISFLWVKTEPVTVRGVLSKEGARYIFRWENSDQTIEVKVFSSPTEALGFAQGQLNLIPGTNPQFDDSIENIWTRNEMGKSIVFWKTWGFSRVHRLTFVDKDHAQVFEQAFKKGAYSPSSLGHAIYFVQQASSQ